jgi:hypothetical protein
LSIQARLSQDDKRFYSVNRDLAHNFGEIMMEVAKRCEEERWDVLTKLLKEKGVGQEDVGKAIQALCRFVATQTDIKRESMPSCMARCGFLDLPGPAKVVVMAYLGTVVLGVHWAGVHEATIGGEGPAMSYSNLRWHGMICSKLMGMPWWRRRLYLLQRRFKKAWRTLWASDPYEDQKR